MLLLLIIIMPILKPNKISLAIFFTLLGASAYAADAAQQSAAISADQQIRQQQRAEALEKTLQPESAVHLGLEQKLQAAPQFQYLTSHSEKICFDIKKFVLTGDDARQFTFAMRSVTQGEHNLIGRCIGVQGLNQALGLIQNDIISHGYVTTRMLLPQQNIASGIIQLQVIAGKVGQVKFAEGASKRAHKFNALPVKSGDILNIRDIEQGLENFKRVPTVEADFKILPSEQRAEPGYSDLELAWQQSKPYRIHLGVDDAGSDSTGKYQGTATLSLDHLFTANDLFYGSYNHDLGGGDSGRRGADGYYLSYSIPLHYWLFSSSFSRSSYYQTVAGASQSYEYSGDSRLINAELSRVIYRDARRKTTASAGGWAVEAAKAAETAARSAENGDDPRLTAIRTGQSAATAAQGAMSDSSLIKAKVSLTAETSSQDSRYNSTDTQGTTINAGENVSVRAGNDIAGMGVQIAGKHVALDAGRDILLSASQNTTHSESKNSGSQFSVGVGVSLIGAQNGISLELGAYQQKGKGNSQL